MRVVSATLQAPAHGILYAVDISTRTNIGAMYCLKEAGYSIVFVRAYEDTDGGQFDHHAIKTLRNAAIANLSFEVFMTPHPRSTKSATTQFSELFQEFKKTGLKLLSVWIQVMNPYKWDSSRRKNTRFINELVKASLDSGVGVNFFTNREHWTRITTYRVWGEGSQLWYTNVDGDGEREETPPDFHDFIPFYPFPGPTAKQFARGEIVCGLKVNRDIFLGAYSLHEPVAGQLGAEKLVVGKVISGVHH
ncbi:hypothetical protein Q1695_013232 [Nippostrongylus brasiliensis]|nr:hypothetical protein Q1695_013232 [Nippostrongylus brasiliensis]